MGVGEWISILEEILTLGAEVMQHPAFRILCDITESKNQFWFFKSNYHKLSGCRHNVSGCQNTNWICFPLFGDVTSVDIK